MEPRQPSNPIIKKAELRHLVENARTGRERDHYTGKRHSTRFTDGMRLEVTTDPARPGASWEVGMHNVSEGGCAFWSRRKVEIRSSLYIRELSPDQRAPWIAGYVTHCTSGIRGCLIGIAFGDRAQGR